MKKLLLLLMALTLTLAFTSCLIVTPPDDDPEEEEDQTHQAIVVGDDVESGALKTITAAIEAASGKTTFIVDRATLFAYDNEIAIGTTSRSVSTAAKEMLEELIDDRAGAPLEYSGWLIYKDADGHVAVCWSDVSSRELAIEKFVESYASLEGLAEAAAGAVEYDVFHLDEYLYRKKWQSLEQTAPADLVAALKHLYNNYYDGPAIVDWIAGLWDPYFCACGECLEKGREIACYGGAFYYANSARDYEGFWPDIESTGFLLSALAHSGAFEQYGSWANAIKEVPGMSESIVRFVQALQDKDDGYFYHPQWGSDIGSERRGRDLNRANQLLSALGAKPLYPTALDRLSGSATSATLTRPLGQSTVCAVSAIRPVALSFESAIKDEDTYMEWLVSITKGDDMFKDSAGAHMLNSVASQIKAAGFLDITLDYLDEKLEQNYEQMQTAYESDPVNNPKPTGLWQQTVDYNLVWGLIKLSNFYRDGDRPYKYPVEAMECCIAVVMFDPEVGGNYHMNDVMNQWAACQQLLENAEQQSPELVDTLYGMVRESAVEMIKQTEGKLAKFIQADGSYGYNQGTSAPTTQGVPVSLGFPEGDSNAYEMAKNTYTYIFKTLGYTPVTFCDWRDGERVLETLRNSSSVVKQPQAEEEKEPLGFDDGEIPSGITTDIKSAGELTIDFDPEYSSNGVLKFVTTSGAGDYVTFSVNRKYEQSSCFVFDADLYLASANREHMYQVYVGGSYMIEILYRNGKVVIRDNCTTANTNKVTYFDTDIDASGWFNLRIEYYKDAENPTALLYVDGDLVGESNNYIGSHKDDPQPANTFSSVKFYSMSKAEGTLYIDNAYFTGEDLTLE